MGLNWNIQNIEVFPIDGEPRRGWNRDSWDASLWFLQGKTLSPTGFVFPGENNNHQPAKPPAPQHHHSKKSSSINSTFKTLTKCSSISNAFQTLTKFP